MKEIYKHRVFGLNIISDINLDAPISDFKVADVCIEHDDLSNYKPSSIDELNKKELLLEIGAVGRFLVKDGNTIKMDLKKGVLEKHARLFLDGYVLSNLMIQRKHIPLHGSGLTIDNNGILIIGRSGAGKSSLTCGLIQKDYKLVTDDLIILDDNYKILPAFSEQKLNMALVEKYDLSKNIVYKNISRTLSMEKMFVNRFNCFEDQPVDLNAIIEISIGGQLELQEVTGVKKIELLLRNLYQEWHVDATAVKEDHFKFITGLAKHVPMYHLVRPIDIDTVDEQIQLLNKVMK